MEQLKEIKQIGKGCKTVEFFRLRINGIDIVILRCLRCGSEDHDFADGWEFLE
jgi:hypothetical protein